MMNDDDDNDDNVYEDALTRVRWVPAAGFGFELQAAIAYKEHIHIHSNTGSKS